MSQILVAAGVCNFFIQTFHIQPVYTDPVCSGWEVELLPQAWEFLYLSDGAGDGRAVGGGFCGNAGAVPDHCGEEMPIYRSVDITTLTCGHELLVVTRTRSQIQTYDRMRSSDIQKEPGVEPLLFGVKRSQRLLDTLL